MKKQRTANHNLWKNQREGQNGNRIEAQSPISIRGPRTNSGWQHESAGPPHGLISHSCMLVPVFFGIWWFYFRQKVSKVFTRLMLKNSAAADEQSGTSTSIAEVNGVYTGEDEFSTWEDVMDHNIPDPSVRFVRWTKASDYRGTARRRAQVRQATRDTLRMAENRPAELSTPMIDVLDEESSQASSNCGVFPENGTWWQCLQDVGVDGIELCSISPVLSDEVSDTALATPYSGAVV